MDHIEFLMVRSATSEEAEISGHALMATCPPRGHIDHHIDHPDDKYAQKMPDVGTADLMKLLDLSARLPLDGEIGEITPIMAWALVRREPEFAKLVLADFDVLKEDLKAKVRCYGYVLSSLLVLVLKLTFVDLAPSWKSLRFGMRLAASWPRKRACSTLDGHHLQVVMLSWLRRDEDVYDGRLEFFLSME